MEYIVEIIKFIVIGIVQGITDILPISSSGHLVIIYNLLNVSSNQQLNLTIFLHLASSLALCVFFKDTIKNILIGTIKYIKYKSNKEDFMLFIYIIVSSIPVAITGLFLKPMVEKNFSNIIFVSIGFLITSITLLILKKIHNKSNDYNFKNTFLVGAFQCLSVFPGISRSGITMLGSKASKLDLNKGKQFTFLLLIPISIGSSILSLFEDENTLIFTDKNIILYIISMIITFIFTYFTLKFFFKVNQEKYYYYYAVYLILLAFLSLTML